MTRKACRRLALGVLLPILFLGSCKDSIIRDNYTPLHTITSSTYTENGIDYLQFTIKFLFASIESLDVKIYDPNDRLTEYVEESTRVYKGIVKIPGTWKFKLNGTSSRRVEDKDQYSTFSTETLVIVD